MDLFQEFRKRDILQEVSSGPLVVGVSGGADSVALLHLLWRLRRDKGWDIRVVHAQHHLRGKESLRDQRFVENLCEKLRLKYRIYSCAVEKFRIKNRARRLGIEEAARILRYRAFSRAALEFKAHFVFTAHTANDQTETFLLNLIRGTGLGGLCGILPKRPLSDVTLDLRDNKVSLIRPLLPFSREEILIYLKSQNLSFCEDSSNKNPDFRRNWVRTVLIPEIREIQPKILERVASCAALLREGDEFLVQELKKMSESVLLLDGRFLDLERYFRYDLNLRKMFLHALFPHESSQFVQEIENVLEKEKSRHHRKIVPMARILNGQGVKFA